MKRGQSFDRGLDVESVICESVVELGLNRGRSLDQKISESLDVWKRVREVLFRDDDFALKDAVIEGGPQFEFPPIHVDDVAELLMQHVSDGIGVGDGGDRAVDLR